MCRGTESEAGRIVPDTGCGKQECPLPPGQICGQVIVQIPVQIFHQILGQVSDHGFWPPNTIL